MRHRPGGGDPVPFGSRDVGGGVEADDRGHARELHPGVGSLGAAQGEVDHRTPVRRVQATGGFGREVGLERDLVQQEGLGELCLRQWRVDLEDRFRRADDRALRHGADPTGEPQTPQPAAEVCGHDAEARQTGDRLVVEVELLEPPQGVVETGSDEVATSRRKVPDEEAERGSSVGH